MISLIKSNKDRGSFNVARRFGMNVIELERNEDVDNAIKKLIENNCTNIVISNEVAGFSEDIIKKYKNHKLINIYIAPRKIRRSN